MTTFEIQSAGGKANAAKMTPEERKEAASKAARARWLKATHSGVLKLLEVDVACFVLENGQRVISQNGMAEALDMSRGGGRSPTGDRIGTFLEGKGISPFVSGGLTMITNRMVRFRLPQGGVTANGYEATALVDVCKTILAADRAGALLERQRHIAQRAQVLIEAFATVAIIALVDEATGYQADRARDELQKILESYVIEEMRPWVVKFPTEFFKQMYKLHGWRFEKGQTHHPQVVGKFINQWIYERLPEPVLPKLREANPLKETGRRSYKHHQFLSDQTGIPHLDRQIATVTALMRAANGDKKLFQNLLSNAFPTDGEQLVLLPMGTKPPDQDQ